MSLIRRYSGIAFDLALVPRGWRADRIPDYDMYLVMPVWLYHIRQLRYAKWWGYRVLVRLGFWKIEEGALYVSGSWTWAWWDTLDRRYSRQFYTFDGRPSGRARMKPASRWERFGWWIQRVIDAYHRDVRGSPAGPWE